LKISSENRGGSPARNFPILEKRGAKNTTVNFFKHPPHALKKRLENRLGQNNFLNLATPLFEPFNKKPLYPNETGQAIALKIYSSPAKGKPVSKLKF